MVEIAGVNVPTWACIAAPTIALIYRYLKSQHGRFQKMGVPGPKPWVVMGTVSSMMKKGLMQHDDDMKKEYGKLVGTFMFMDPILLVYDLDMLKDIMIKEFNHFENHPVPLGLSYVLRKMLPMLKSEHWRHVRNTLSPIFTGGKLRRMNVAINRCANNLVQNIGKMADKGDIIELQQHCRCYALDVIAAVAFGLDSDGHNNPNSDFMKHCNAMTKMKEKFTWKILFFMISPRLMAKMKIPLFPSDSLNYFMNLIDTTIRDRVEEEEKARDFLQLVVDKDVGDPAEKDVASNPDLVKSADGVVWSKSGLTREEILATALLFFTAGMDTVASGLSFLLYNLAVNPDKQETLLHEVTAVMHGKEEVEYDTVKEMSYLHMCVEESLRLYPPSARTDRVCTADITLGGVHLEEGTSIGIPVWAIHRDADIWPEPDKFIPERFTPEEKEARHPMAWMPFGHGPRNCIAMRLALLEIKVATVQIIQKYKLTTCDKTPIPPKLSTFLMSAEGGLNIQVEERQSTSE